MTVDPLSKSLASGEHRLGIEILALQVQLSLLALVLMPARANLVPAQHRVIKIDFSVEMAAVDHLLSQRAKDGPHWTRRETASLRMQLLVSDSFRLTR